MRNVTIENVGPIDRLAIPLPDSGIVVLRGRNGVGKSHALEAVEAAVGKRGRPPVKDHAKRGLVEGLGVKLTISRSTRRTGEAEVQTLEGKLDISQLVDPGLKDEEVADRTRIKALIQLSGASADQSQFASILPAGVELGELISAEDLSGDPVTVAGKMKRALEAEARRHEKTAEDAASKAAALQDQAGQSDKADLDLRRKDTEAQLQDALVKLQKLETQAEEAARRMQQADKARKTLEALRSQIPADQSIEGLETEEASLTDKIQRLERALAVAQERRQQVRRQLDQARLVAGQIEQLAQVIAAEPESVPVEEVEIARKRVEVSRDLHRRSIEAKRTRQLAGQADEHHQMAKRAEGIAERYREAARATDDVLSDLVGRATHRLRVDADRLVCDTDRGVEPFSELSPGERWRIALEIAAEQVGQGGLVTVPQQAWESLDPIHRAEIAAIAHQVGVLILTAEATGDEQIVSEVLDS